MGYRSMELLNEFSHAFSVRLMSRARQPRVRLRSPGLMSVSAFGLQVCNAGGVQGD